MRVIYHRLINKDLRIALDWYESEGGIALGDRFFAEAELTVKLIESNPKGFHFSDGGLRRAALESFPYHFLYEYEEEVDTVWITVLRHDHRHPSFGLRRRW